ncbi:MAG: cytochrome c [Bacteroidota bacterium]|nr:cytochrome c [Bacteroidota bacterium]
MKKLICMMGLITALMSFQSGPKKITQKPVQSANNLQASITRGKEVYLLQCLACHQIDGGGVANLNPPLDGATAVKANDKARLIRIVLQGLNDRKEIDGEFYANNMAPHPDLTDQQIADVLTYVRNSWSNKASAVTPAEVKAVRAKIK